MRNKSGTLQSSDVADSDIAAALLDIESIGNNRFLNNYNQDNQLGVLFGGQLLAQGIAAARQTVDNREIHNCNALFPFAGTSRQPIEYLVEIVRDGKRFSNRRITGRQGDRILLDMLCSFQERQQGLEHQLDDAPRVAAPESILTEIEFFRTHAEQLPGKTVEAFTLPFPVEICTLDAEKLYLEESRQLQRSYWFRLPSADSLTSEAQHNAILAFLADYRLGGVALAPHISPLAIDRFKIATLNHSMWFHFPARTDEWLLYTTDSPWAGSGRGLAKGSIYNREGRLVVSAVQELMVGIRE